MGGRLQGVEDGEGRVGAVVDDSLRGIERTTLTPLARTGGEKDETDDDGQQAAHGKV